MISGDRSVLQGKHGAFWYTLEEFSRHWDQIDVICPHVDSTDLQFRDSFPTVFFFPCPGNLLHQSQWIVSKGSELTTAHHPDVMTVHEYFPFYNGIGAARLSRQTGIPYALEIHHIVGHPHAASLVELVGRSASRLYLKRDSERAAAVRVVNTGAKETLKSYGVPEKKIHVVPSFYLNRDVITQYGHAEKKFDVVFCARLVGNKGLFFLIEAMSDLPGRTLLVVGHGPGYHKARRYVEELGLGNRVTFSGWLDTHESVIAALASGRVFVMNSMSEGGPRVALEAMACRLPVVATRVGVMPDVIRDGVNGLFTDGRAKDLAAKINLLLRDETLRHRLGLEAEKVLDRFDRRTLIREYAEFLKGLSE